MTPHLTCFRCSPPKKSGGYTPLYNIRCYLRRSSKKIKADRFFAANYLNPSGAKRRRRSFSASNLVDVGSVVSKKCLQYSRAYDEW